MTDKPGYTCDICESAKNVGPVITPEAGVEYICDPCESEWIEDHRTGDGFVAFVAEKRKALKQERLRAEAPAMAEALGKIIREATMSSECSICGEKDCAPTGKPPARCCPMIEARAVLARALGEEGETT